MDLELRAVPGSGCQAAKVVLLVLSDASTPCSVGGSARMFEGAVVVSAASANCAELAGARASVRQRGESCSEANQWETEPWGRFSDAEGPFKKSREFSLPLNIWASGGIRASFYPFLAKFP